MSSLPIDAVGRLLPGDDRVDKVAALLLWGVLAFMTLRTIEVLHDGVSFKSKVFA